MTLSQPLDQSRSATRAQGVRYPVGRPGRSRPSALGSRAQSSTVRSPARSGSLRSAHPQSLPAWVETLRWWQRTSTILALLSCSTVLGIYSWTVYTQERWNQQYEALQQMRRHERQYLLSHESIANSLRDTAARSEMVPLVPERMIEVPIASPRPETETAATQRQRQEEPFFPVGY